MMKSIRQTILQFTRWLILGERNGVRRSIQGSGNQIKLEGATYTNLEIDIIGDNNLIEIGSKSLFNNVTFHVRGSGHHISFGQKCTISRGAILWFEDNGCSLQVGDNTSMVDVHIAVTEPGSRVTIGADCMFANDIDIRTGDSHSIIDPDSGERLNHASDVVIKNHVWIAPHVVVLKGVHIGENSVLATGSVVTKSCEPGIIMAGNPASAIKTGISWKRERIKKIIKAQ